MNQKVFITLFSSIFLFSACSSNPNRTTSDTLTNIGLGTLVVGGLALAAKGDDEEDEEDDDDSKKVGAVAIGLLLAGALIGTYEGKKELELEKERKRIAEQKRKEELEIRRKREEKLRNRKGKKEYEPQELNMFFRDYAGVNFDISPYNKVKNATSQGDPMKFKVTPVGNYIEEYRPTIIPTYPSGLFKNNCTHIKSEEDSAKDWKQMSISDIASGFLGQKRVTTTFIFTCNYTNNDINRRISYFRKLGIKDSSSIMNLARKNKTKTVLTTQSTKALENLFNTSLPTYITTFRVDDDTGLLSTNVKDLEISISSSTFPRTTRRMGKGLLSRENVEFNLPSGNYNVQASGVDSSGKSLFSFQTKVNISSSGKNCTISLYRKDMNCYAF